MTLSSLPTTPLGPSAEPVRMIISMYLDNGKKKSQDALYFQLSKQVRRFAVSSGGWLHSSSQSRAEARQLPRCGRVSRSGSVVSREESALVTAKRLCYAMSFNRNHGSAASSCEGLRQPEPCRVRIRARRPLASIGGLGIFRLVFLSNAAWPCELLFRLGIRGNTQLL